MERKRTRQRPRVVSMERGLQELVRNRIAERVYSPSRRSRRAARGQVARLMRLLTAELRASGKAQTNRGALQMMEQLLVDVEREDQERMRRLADGLVPVMSRKHSLDDLVIYWIADRGTEDCAPLPRRKLHAELNARLDALTRLFFTVEFELKGWNQLLAPATLDPFVAAAVTSIKELMFDAMSRVEERAWSAPAVAHALRRWRKRGASVIRLELIVVVRHLRASVFAELTAREDQQPPATIVKNARKACVLTERAIEERVRVLTGSVLPIP